MLLQLNKHLARRTIIRTNSFCSIFRSGLEEVYCQLSQGGNFILIQIRVCLSFPEFKESKYKNFPEGKRNMREISGTSLKSFSLIVKIPQGSSVL